MGDKIPARVIASVREQLVSTGHSEISDVVSERPIRFFVVPADYRVGTLAQDDNNYVVTVPESVPEDLRAIFAMGQLTGATSQAQFPHPEIYIPSEVAAIPRGKRRGYLETRLALLNGELTRLMELPIDTSIPERESLIQKTSEYYSRELKIVKRLLAPFDHLPP